MSTKLSSAALVFSLLIYVAAQDKATVWTKVIGSGNTVSVSWDKKHPWDMNLMAKGADLIAEYQTERQGVVSEVVAKAGPGGLARTFRFTLPETVKSEPKGGICLYVQPAGGKTLLPVRMPGSDKADTARFRYEVWSASVLRRATERSASMHLEADRNSLASIENRIATQEKTLADRGWTTPERCDTQTFQSPSPLVKPYDVVEPSAQDDTARRICIYRAWSGATYRNELFAGYVKAKPNEREETRGFFANSFRRVLLPDILSDSVVSAATGLTAARRAQIAIFNRDWSRWSASSKDYDPQLKDFLDFDGHPSIPLPTDARSVAFRVWGPVLAKGLGAEWLAAGATPPRPEDFAGTIGAAIDAYSTCVEDSHKELQIKYDSWAALKEAAPQRAVAERDFMVRECRDQTTKLQQLKANAAELSEQVSREEQTLARPASQAREQASQVLNTLSCSLR